MLQTVKEKVTILWEKNGLQERTERIELACSVRQKWKKWISTIITLKKVKKKHSDSSLCSKYRTESKWFNLQHVKLEINIRSKLSNFKWSKILERVERSGDGKNLIIKVYNNKLEIFQYETEQLYQIPSNIWSGCLHDLFGLAAFYVSMILWQQSFKNITILYSENTWHVMRGKNLWAIKHQTFGKKISEWNLNDSIQVLKYKVTTEISPLAKKIKKAHKTLNLSLCPSQSFSNLK